MLQKKKLLIIGTVLVALLGVIALVYENIEKDRPIIIKFRALSGSAPFVSQDPKLERHGNQLTRRIETYSLTLDEIDPNPNPSPTPTPIPIEVGSECTFEVTLSWDNTMDPLNPEKPNPKIVIASHESAPTTITFDGFSLDTVTACKTCRVVQVKSLCSGKTFEPTGEYFKEVTFRARS